jgi:hypothetical protein
MKRKSSIESLLKLNQDSIYDDDDEIKKDIDCQALFPDTDSSSNIILP